MRTARKTTPPPPLPDGWTVSPTYALSMGRELAEGDECTIRLPTGRGALTRVRFMRHVSTMAGEWVDVWDGRRVRSFHPDAITTVHRTTRMPARS